MIRYNTTKAEIGNQIAKDFGPLGITQDKCQTAINAFCLVVGEYLANGREVHLRGVGTFYVKTRKSRPVRNPRTGEALTLPKRRVPLFRFSSEIKGKIKA